jgi:acyl carrier protein
MGRFGLIIAAMSDAIYTQLTDVFRDVLDDEALELSPELTAKDVPGWDSLSHIRLMLSVERAFDVKLSASEIGKLKTVGDLVELVARKTA